MDAKKVRKENLDTLPFDVLLAIFRILAGSQASSIIPMSAILAMSRVCRTIRFAIVGYPLFWNHISSGMAEGLQLACLSRSQDHDLHIAGACYPSRYKEEQEEEYKRLAFTLGNTLCHAHRWTTFEVTLCSGNRNSSDREPEERYDDKNHFIVKRHHQRVIYQEDYGTVRRLLHQRKVFPRLRKISIRYYLLDGDDKEFYLLQDVGGNGNFYTNWKTPKLTELTAINYAPFPFIARTITSLTLSLSNQVNNAQLVESLPRAKSLKELHFVFSDRASWAKPTNRLEVTQLPQIEILSLNFRYAHKDARQPAKFVGKIFRFPNLSSLKISVDERRGSTPNIQGVTILDVVHCFGQYLFCPLRTLTFDGMNAQQSSEIEISVPFPSSRHLKFTGTCWHVLDPASSPDDPNKSTNFKNICDVLEQITLLSCGMGVLPLVKDVMKPNRGKKLRIVQATSCTPKLVNSLEDIMVVSPQILRVR